MSQHIGSNRKIVIVEQASQPTRIPIRTVERWATEALRKAGLSAADAEVTAASLAFAEERGVQTHGFIRLLTYVQRAKAGGIKGSGVAKIASDLGALVIVDADHVVGASSAMYAAGLAVERARRHGIGCVAVRNANHFGVAAFYSSRIADAGLLGLVVCNTDKVMCVPGGGRAVLGTNPLAVTVPMPAEVRPQLDMATTEVSQGRLIMAARNCEPIPLGWAVDAEGLPTTSAAAGLNGALLPAGGPKGFGLSFAIDALVALSGALTSDQVGALYGDPKEPQRLGQLFMAIRADAGVPLETYQKTIADLVEAIHGSGPASGGNKPLAPGEPELARVRQNQGLLSLTEMLTDALSEISASTGLALPDEIDEARTKTVAVN